MVSMLVVYGFNMVLFYEGKGMPSKVRVVVVEDMEIVRQGLRALLETCQECSVCGEAADGLEAIECVGREKPDVSCSWT